MKYKDKIAIVTGASFGIGKAIALLLAEQGCHVVCTARSTSKIEEVASIIRAKSRKAIAITTDVSNKVSVKEMVDKVFKEFGKIDILINNAGGPMAGISYPTPKESNDFFDVMDKLTFINISDKDWDSIFNINFYGMLNSVRYVLPIMMKQDSGDIINISSKAGKTKADVVPGMIAYASAKGALTRFTEVLAFELMCAGSKVRINSVSPGMVATSFHENLPPDQLEGYRKPDEIKDILFKVLDNTDNVSGETLSAETFKTWAEELKEGI